MLDFSYYILHFVYAFVTTYAFAVLFDSPKSLSKYSAVSGGSAWVVFKLLTTFNMPFVIPYFFASFIIALFSEAYARALKHPSIIFTIPALIPFVPGYGIYYTILNMLKQSYNDAIQSGTEAIFIAVAIAAGVIFSTSICRVLFKKNKRLFN